MTSRRQPRVVINGRVLNNEQRAGRACIYCPVTFGPLDPLPTVTGIEGVMFDPALRCQHQQRGGLHPAAIGHRGHAHRTRPPVVVSVRSITTSGVGSPERAGV